MSNARCYFRIDSQTAVCGHTWRHSSHDRWRRGDRKDGEVQVPYSHPFTPQDNRVSVISRRIKRDRCYSADGLGTRFYVCAFGTRRNISEQPSDGWFQTEDAAARWARAAGYDVVGYDFQAADRRSYGAQHPERGYAVFRLKAGARWEH